MLFKIAFMILSAPSDNRQNMSLTGGFSAPFVSLCKTPETLDRARHLSTICSPFPWAAYKMSPPSNRMNEILGGAGGDWQRMIQALLDRDEAYKENIREIFTRGAKSIK